MNAQYVPPNGLEYFWGKAQPAIQDETERKASPVMHPLIAHLLDVAAVAVSLADKEDVAGLDRQQLGFLVALHDIGKILPGFQAKVPQCWPKNVLGEISPQGYVSGRHTADGLALLGELVESELFQEFLKAVSAIGVYDLLGALAGHHGQPVRETESFRLWNEADFKRAEHLVTFLFEVFRPEPLPKLRGYILQRLTWRLAQLTVLADWIGSRQEWFPYVTPETLRDPAVYYNQALKQARHAIIAAGLDTIEVTPFADITSLFPHIAAPSPVQKLLGEITLPEGPCLVIVEDMTGSGKTEAALLLGQRLMAEKRQKGLFVALPTMATANAMYERLKLAYHRLFQSSTKPSLALAHGKARLEERFSQIIEVEDEKTTRAAYSIESDRSDHDNIPAEAFCTAWLASETRRSLLAQIGVGTIDQALMSVLPVRFATLRQAGLAGKILIIDECHAFDSYMKEEMQALLRFHAAMGGSAILLSATLMHETRQSLVNAFQEGLKQEPLSVKNDSYPLVTLASATQLLEEPCAPRSGLSRRIAVRRLDNLDSARAEIIQAVQQKAAVAWIRNTVDDVITEARKLWAQNIKTQVFHARFAMGDRLEIEKRVLKCFGKESKGAERESVLLASQVIEQSLDLDFDVLCTDLAPMDLLIQRAGRLWRHKRLERSIEKEELLVISPEPVADPKADWITSLLPKTAKIYDDPALLWRTARFLFERGEIVSPEEIRTLIEEAGNEGNIPPNLEKASAEAQGKDRAGKNQAKQNVLNFEAGYSPGTALWDKEIKTPTRLDDDQKVMVRLAVERNGEVIPWMARERDSRSARKEELQRDWALSEISVPQRRLSACPPPPGLEAAIIKARNGWSRFEREAQDLYLLLVLKPEEEGWEGVGRAEKDNNNFNIRYTLDYGLEWVTCSQ